MPPTQLKIGDLADRTGTTPPTIRYYEAIGLLPSPTRQSGGQRRYDEEAVHRLTFLRRLRDFGFTIEQVRELVALTDDPARDCSAARDIGRAHLEAIQARLKELRALERDMTDFVHRCETACAGGPGSACVPLVALKRGEPDRRLGRRTAPPSALRS